MKDRRFIFRVDGGNVYSIAMGHVYRCLRLADHIMRKKAGDITFFMKNYPEGVNKVEGKYKVQLIPSNMRQEDEAAFIAAKIIEGDIFICDVRGINNGYIRYIRDKTSLFCYFDDLCVPGIEPDMVINPSPYANISFYSSGKCCEYLVGLEYFILDSSYGHRKEAPCSEVKKILLSFGGADPTDITGKFISNIKASFKDFSYTVVLGCAYGKEKEVKLSKIVDTRRKEGFSIEVEKDVDDLCRLFMDVDVAFVAGGDTCLECIYTGTPTFIISSIDYEDRVARFLSEKKAAFYAGFIEETDMATILENAENALKDKAVLEDLHRNGRKIVDGKGLERIANRILEKIA